MSSNEVTLQSMPERIDVALLNRKFAGSNYNPEEVEKALEEGLNPNIQWDQIDIEGRRHRTGGCVIRSFDPERSWANHNTPLHMSVEKYKFDTAAILLKHGAQINLLNALGRTALHEAIFRSDSEAVKFLVDNGADINAVSEERSFKDQYRHLSGIAGILPLHEAIRAWNLQAVELLVEGGADLLQTSPGGWTILDLALLERNESITNFLYKHGARFSEGVAFGENASPESLREMAKVLLEDTNIFPPSTCRAVYLCIIGHPDFLDSLREYSKSPAPDCSRLFETFFSLLSSKAEKPNPDNVPGAPKCTQCAKFLKEMSPQMTAPFKLHPDRSSLKRSASEGCCLCAVFEDALVHQGGRFAQPGKKLQQAENATEVFLTSSFSIFNIRVTIHCENQREALEVYGLSDAFMIDQRRFPDDAELGTSSPRAFKTAQAWLKNCQLHHSACSKEEDANPVLPTRVIDVGNETIEPCLHVSNGERAAYLALSYCRGRSTDIATTKESLRDRTDAIHLSSLPLTLRDAVLATRKLGFRFLWVDAICIIQDDADDSERETRQMGAIYANATITLSAHDSEDCHGGLYRPRPDHITSPVQVSLRIPKKYQEERLVHKTSYFIISVHGEKELLEPGPVNTQAWTLQEHLMSTRVLHWGPGILYWECLTSHGSESDPEGDTHPYKSSCTNFMDVRHRKRILQGRIQERDISYQSWADDYRTLEKDDSDEEPEPETDDTAEPVAIDEDAILDDEVSSCEDGNSDGGDIEEGEAEADEEVDLKKITYLQWQNLVSEYSSRALVNPTDKIPAFLGLSEIVAKAIQDEFVVGVWKKSHFLPSLLWAAFKPGGRSRNQNLPSWTWASIDGRVNYPISFSRIRWEPSEATLDVQTFGPSQNHAIGSITLRSRVRKFPEGFKFWRYENQLLNPYMTYTFGRSKDWETKSSKELQQDLTVIEGFRDLRAASPEAKEAGGWEGARSEIYCVVIARIGKKPPPKFGYPAFPGGRPKSLVCLCLSPLQQANTETEAQRNVFRRVGLCHFWDTPAFWKGASKDERVTII
ncbi:hypothetical protein E0Z10_g6678 [Xylaria hypoxylon]|uniref:Heterokaryon incompatibility domain-containing protein n=1 Tax=Xylaria hypoxylon TaxID=37992 RepID=A0A4Z0YXG5_9PEZI|nr:hypothetical protein E0Z10_g6678 [Xylaria hypoxylon]